MVLIGSLFINIKKGTIFFFDSVGKTIPAQIKKFVNMVKRQGIHLKDKERIEFTYDENHPHEHQMGDTECGIYSLYFIIHVLEDKHNEEYFKTHTITDKCVSKFRKIYFNESFVKIYKCKARVIYNKRQVIYYIMTTIVDMISNNKTTSMFVKEDNVNLLWKIIINTPAFKTTIESNGVEAQQKLRSYYIQHVRTFVEENIYDTSSIVDFNKKFISYFIKKFQPSSNENVNTTLDQSKTSISEVQKLHIDTTNNLDKSAITIEEIKSERLNEFEDKYQKIQNDFDVYRKNEVPDSIDFSDKNRDRPIDNNDFQQQISSTNEERKTQETTFSTNTDSHTQRMKWLNLKEKPKSLLPESTVFDKPFSSSQTNEKDKEQSQKAQPNKNELVSEEKPPVIVQDKESENKVSPYYLWSTIVQSNKRIDVLNKTVEVLKKIYKN